MYDGVELRERETTVVHISPGLQEGQSDVRVGKRLTEERDNVGKHVRLDLKEFGQLGVIVELRDVAERERVGDGTQLSDERNIVTFSPNAACRIKARPIERRLCVRNVVA